MTWEEVLQRSDLVGGELETQEDGCIYRGPIGKIELKDGYLHITSPWVARLDPSSGSGWKKWENNPFFVDAKLATPRDIGEGRIHFNVLGLGHATIFPAGGSKLDPVRVEGLSLTNT